MEIKQVTLEKIYTTDTDKEGKPLISKKGKPYTRMSLITKEIRETVDGEDKGRWIGGFKNKVTEKWSEGDVVTIGFTEVEFNGKMYANFSTPTEADIEIATLKAELAAKNQ